MSQQRAAYLQHTTSQAGGKQETELGPRSRVPVTKIQDTKN